MGEALAFAFPLEGTVCIDWSQIILVTISDKDMSKLTNGRDQRWMNGRWFREIWNFLLVPVI